jgi:hypothetical protein
LEQLVTSSEHYPAWRFGIRVLILGKYSTRAKEVKAFLAKLEDMTSDEMAVYEMNDFEEQAESKLYTALIGCCKSKDHSD